LEVRQEAAAFDGLIDELIETPPQLDLINRSTDRMNYRRVCVFSWGFLLAKASTSSARAW
jgi:hypothetical protein